MFTEPYLGNVTIFGGNFAPRNWAYCDGSLLSISQNTALFSLIGTTYGGDGQTNFALPNLGGRFAIGTGQGPGLSNFVLGAIGGSLTLTVSVAQMPQHNHSVISATGGPGASTVAGTTDKPAADVPATVNGASSCYTTSPSTAMMGSVTIPGATTISGGSQPIDCISPYLAMNYIICVEGIFPSRN
jgi:microcystin-dependent protein